MTIPVMQELLAYLPHLSGHLKTANQTLEASSGYPISNRDMTIVSAHKVMYLEKIAHKPVSSTISHLVKKAAALYGVLDHVEKAISELEGQILQKSASASRYSAEVENALHYVHNLHQSRDVNGLVKVARSLNSESPGHQEVLDSPLLQAYLQPESLDKSNICTALSKRAFMTGSNDYLDLLTVVKSVDFRGLTKEANQKILDSINHVDTENHLHFKGWNIYTEALTKNASETFKMGSKEVGLQQILEVLPALQDALGKDTVKEILDAGPEAGPIIASLPVDLKAIIGRYA